MRGTETIPIAGVNPPRLFPYLRALGDLIGLVWRGLEPGRDPLRLPRDPASEEPGAVQLAGIVGESRAMLAVFEAIERIAPTDASVLVRGESGTGKELVARAIHDRSARRTGPFVAISCPRSREI
ncbi:MAG: sigma 54-interacting transcriptional regulator [Candidatus Eisenbacteria bacterium]|nr:sigma 54-interacting transcriptional regulator [Candidatus Eisenbacteria bacterium]